jgi:hypothetical protein
MALLALSMTSLPVIASAAKQSSFVAASVDCVVAALLAMTDEAAGSAFACLAPALPDWRAGPFASMQNF